MDTFDMNENNIVSYYDTKYHFSEKFNRKTGAYARTDDDTGKDPFMRSFPGLLDIGICGGCKASESCKVGCYQGGKSFNPDNDMTFENYKKIIDEGSQKGLQQVALGGAGNPNDHADFEQILRYTANLGIIPNYTTAGIGLTDEMVRATKQYCGAVAVSDHRRKYTFDALDKFLLAGCKTNIHFVLSVESIGRAITLLKEHALTYVNETTKTLQTYDLNTHNINAIIFLLYKPVGLGVKENMLVFQEDSTLLKEFFSLIAMKHPFKIGFDSCSIPGIVNFASDIIDENSIDTCEGGRFSAYVTPDMKMLPCSFDNQTQRWAVSLDNATVEAAWNSDQFNDFRDHFKRSCPNCKKREICMGGCPIVNDIVLCDKPERSR